MLIYDTEGEKPTLLTRDQLVPDQGIKSVGALGNGDLVLGMTTAAGTGGNRVAQEADLALFDWQARKITFRCVPVPGAYEIRDLVVGPDDRVYGLALGEQFFVFDTATRKVVHSSRLEGYGDDTGGQASRVMAIGPDGYLYVLFTEAIVRIDLHTLEHSAVGRPPRSPDTGIAIHDGRLYFSHDANLWSFRLDTARQ